MDPSETHARNSVNNEQGGEDGTEDRSHSAFFYGVLMHPEVLLKIIGNDGAHLEIAPATLQSYTRHHVKRASFPAIIPYDQSVRFFGTDMPQDKQHVKGVAVRGLSMQDMRRIVSFEGAYYKLVSVRVHPVSCFIAMQEAAGSSAFIDQLRELEHADTSEEVSEESMIKVLTHLWDMPINDLSEEVWAFDRFVREKITIWL